MGAGAGCRVIAAARASLLSAAKVRGLRRAGNSTRSQCAEQEEEEEEKEEKKMMTMKEERKENHV